MSFAILMQYQIDMKRTVHETHIFKKWSDTFIEVGEKIGKTFLIAERMKYLIEDAGFINVVETKYKKPIRGWAADPKLKELGNWGLLHAETGVEGRALAILTRVLGVSEVHFFLFSFFSFHLSQPNSTSYGPGKCSGEISRP
jgi:hypothetical protein